ncbi:hypothetical protein C8Q74DRAFT_984348 [Fomes fomentarius]|nr:hypothetical protein C8Q74DRAFT_984348 [Fomes fomentarius]
MCSDSRLVSRPRRSQGRADERGEMAFSEADNPYRTSAVKLTEMSPSGMTPVTEPGRPSEQSTPLNIRPLSSPTGSIGQPNTDDTYSVATSATLPPSYHTRRSEPDLTDYLLPLPRPEHPWPSYHPGYSIPTPHPAPVGLSVSYSSGTRLDSEATERTRGQIENLSNQDGIMRSVRLHGPLAWARPRKSQDGGIRLEGGPLGDANTDGGARPPS